jgi:hypothetical protein
VLEHGTARIKALVYFRVNFLYLGEDLEEIHDNDKVKEEGMPK